jgi:tetratricopeptide (TPR) repeat protein
MGISMPESANGIFICYRREDTDWPASWLFNQLARHFGKDLVFKDVDKIEPGEDFVEKITTALRSCRVLLVLVGDKWLTATDESGRRRLNDPQDFVRLEIETALSRDVSVVPLLVGRTQMPRAADLPPSLEKLAYRQAVALDPSRFGSDADRLMTVLDRILSGPDQAIMTRREPPREDRTHNEFPGTVGKVVQARDIHGNLRVLTPSASSLSVPRQLPRDIATFTGRETDLAWLDNLLGRITTEQQSAEVMISAVVGAAGVGKSTLVVHWAHKVRDRFPDGDLFVNLRGYDPGPPLTPEQALEGFLLALDVQPERIPHRLDAQEGLFRTLLNGRRMLIVLDNASSADQVRPLLPDSPGCMVVITSRSQLSGLVARDGAHRLTLEMLSPHEAVTLLRLIIGTDRVDAEPEAVAELIDRCACLPLTLRIAAERVAIRPHVRLSDLAADLMAEDDRLDALTICDDEATQVRHVFSWSYRALPGQTARAFRFLGLHEGPDIGIPAAAALTGTTMAEARRLLDALTSMHLLEQAVPTRYRFHDLLRLYAKECARAETPDEDRRTAIRQLLTWYLQTADAADHVLIPRGHHVSLESTQESCRPMVFADSSRALSWCEAERANLLAAIHQAIDMGEYDIAWKLPAALWSFFTLRKHWTDWITTYGTGLEAANISNDRRGEISMLNGLGVAYWELRRFDDALTYYNRALVLCRENGDPRDEGRTLNNIGDVHWSLGRFGEAHDCYLRSLTLRREAGDQWGEANTLHNLSDNYRDMGRWDEALKCYEQALAVWRKIGDRWGEGATLNGLGSVHQSLGRWDEAIDCYQRSFSLRRETGDRWGEADTLNRISEVLSSTGQPDAARKYLRQALAILDDLGAPKATEIRDRLQIPTSTSSD